MGADQSQMMAQMMGDNVGQDAYFNYIGVKNIYDGIVSNEEFALVKQLGDKKEIDVTQMNAGQLEVFSQLRCVDSGWMHVRSWDFSQRFIRDSKRVAVASGRNDFIAIECLVLSGYNVKEAIALCIAIPAFTKDQTPFGANNKEELWKIMLNRIMRKDIIQFPKDNLTEELDLPICSYPGCVNTASHNHQVNDDDDSPGLDAI